MADPNWVNDLLERLKYLSKIEPSKFTKELLFEAVHNSSVVNVSANQQYNFTDIKRIQNYLPDIK